MAVPVLETVGTVTDVTSNSTNATINAPSGIADDDILIAIVALDGDAANPTITDFATITSASEGAVEVYFLWKRASSESGNYTINWTGSEQGRMFMIRVSGCITTGDPWDVISSSVTNTTDDNVINRLTSTVVDTLAIYAVAVDRAVVDGADTITGTGWTEVGTSGSSGGNGGAGLIAGENDMASIAQVEAGTFGTWSLEQSVSRGFNLKAPPVAAVGKHPNVVNISAMI